MLISYSFLSVTTTSLFCMSLLSPRALSLSATRPWKEAANHAADLLAKAQSVVFVTGAGISAESGIPTYRGVAGLYNDNNQVVEEVDGRLLSIEECLCASTYARHPAVTWKYLLQIERACRGAQPSRAHQLIQRAEHFVDRVTVMTQNVDGLHQRAGSSNVLCLHGNLYSLRCTNCGHKEMVDSFGQMDHLISTDGSLLSLPTCTKCGSKSIRPDVVLFDEYLGDATIARYESLMNMSMMDLMIDGGSSTTTGSPPYDLSVSIGTSALFPYVNAAGLSGKRSVDINPVDNGLSSQVDIHIAAGASESLEYMFQKLGWH